MLTELCLIRVSKVNEVEKWGVFSLYLKFFCNYKFTLFCVVDHVFLCMGVEVIEVLEGIDSWLPPCRPQGLSTGCQAWWLKSSPTSQGASRERTGKGAACLWSAWFKKASRLRIVTICNCWKGGAGFSKNGGWGSQESGQVGLDFCQQSMKSNSERKS